jgi:hypothetical protein
VTEPGVGATRSVTGSSCPTQPVTEPGAGATRSVTGSAKGVADHAPAISASVVTVFQLRVVATWASFFSKKALFSFVRP